MAVISGQSSVVSRQKGRIGRKVGLAEPAKPIIHIPRPSNAVIASPRSASEAIQNRTKKLLKRRHQPAGVSFAAKTRITEY
jgi:hypothetical protein